MLMAKFKKAFRKARRSFARRGVSRSSGGMKTTTTALYAAGYGALRNKAQSLAAPLTSKVPSLGGVSGYSLAAGIVGYMAAKKGKGMIKQAGTAILISEAFVAGSSVGGSMTNTSSNGIVLN